MQHMVEERNARIDIALARAVDADRHSDLGFARFAVDGGAAGLGECIGDLGSVGGLHSPGWHHKGENHLLPLSRLGCALVKIE
jgi:hypothetical protein